MGARERLDVRVHAAGLAESREQAQRLILAGEIFVDGHPVHKPGHRFGADCVVTRRNPPRYVSRGGFKLEAAFAAFALDVHGRVCVDVGASTGGFTDCLLQNGAARVYCVDVGNGQLHGRLRADPRVVVLDKVNARHITPDLFDPLPSFATVDVSFISLEKVLPSVLACLARPCQVVSLVKPQFEAGREQVERGGVVRDAAVRAAVAARVRAVVENVLGATWWGCIESPVHGPAGNIEYLAWWGVDTSVRAATAPA